MMPEAVNVTGTTRPLDPPGHTQWLDRIRRWDPTGAREDETGRRRQRSASRPFALPQLWC